MAAVTRVAVKFLTTYVWNCAGGKVSCGNLKTMPQFHWPKLMPLELGNLNG